MFKSLLVPLVLGTIDRSALHAACAIAEREAGHVTALVGLNAISPMVSGWEYFPAGIYDTLDETTKSAAAALARDVSEVLKHEAVAHSVRVAGSFWLTPAEQTILHARLADLVVLGRSDKAQEPEKRLFGSALLGSGRPLLIVPPMANPTAGFEHVVVAWKPAREAARALHDAMPLLRQARIIDLLTITGSASDQARLEDEDADVLRYFTHHGLAVNQVLRSRGSSSGQEILTYATRSHADLIVAGGYGRRRVTEQVFGGVTRFLFENAQIPVLFSH
ncbi:universal stress protein [Luteimonas sp. 22616]|uniref:universal stress protein n=1 Tax=Luteimonas sp. 22616 TaxID=3453951 RepID=UPI003F855EAB